MYMYSYTCVLHKVEVRFKLQVLASQLLINVMIRHHLSGTISIEKRKRKNQLRRPEDQKVLPVSHLTPIWKPTAVLTKLMNFSWMGTKDSNPKS